VFRPVRSLSSARYLRRMTSCAPPARCSSLRISFQFGKSADLARYEVGNGGELPDTVKNTIGVDDC
jgi:hypothetical protein